ncbi:uncharacterized protein LOC117141066 [Drosophila mauritiana]|uniref:Uncharacterized protein LOC117141066 n=1 Tax=Drosophila mauritiana TaxID=7226 RepID=A0A6P8JU22_DROMA|nr:uncharacterized protein LOC117141066 [Drosophila mauritiana]XP_033160253.1 uncharacterized protein LOC117141066 [Drosophila mauritiana]
MTRAFSRSLGKREQKRERTWCSTRVIVAPLCLFSWVARTRWREGRKRSKDGERSGARKRGSKRDGETMAQTNNNSDSSRQNVHVTSAEGVADVPMIMLMNKDNADVASERTSKTFSSLSLITILDVSIFPGCLFIIGICICIIIAIAIAIAIVIIIIMGNVVLVVPVLLHCCSSCVSCVGESVNLTLPGVHAPPLSLTSTSTHTHTHTRVYMYLRALHRTHTRTQWQLHPYNPLASNILLARGNCCCSSLTSEYCSQLGILLTPQKGLTSALSLSLATAICRSIVSCALGASSVKAFPLAPKEKRQRSRRRQRLLPWQLYQCHEMLFPENNPKEMLHTHTHPRHVCECMCATSSSNNCVHVNPGLFHLPIWSTVLRIAPRIRSPRAEKPAGTNFVRLMMIIMLPLAWRTEKKYQPNW